MNLSDFITKYNGQRVDVDGFPTSNPYQCMDLYRKYVDEVWGLPQTPTVQGAFQVFDSIGQGYDKFTQGHILPGDVMTWTSNYAPNGHIGIVVSSSPTTMQVFEQNNPINSACGTHTHNYGNIKGWFRPVSSQIAKTFMSITVDDNAHWSSLQSQLDLLKQWFIHYSNNRLEPVFDIKQTNFSAVPFSPLNEFKAPDINWYRQNITPLTKGQGTLLLLPYSQWQTSPVAYTWGFMSWGDTNKPVRMQCTGAENEIIPSNTQGGYDTAPVFVHRAFHEICHMLFYLTNQPDRVHEFLLVAPDRRAELLDLVDYRALQSALVKIKN